MHNQKRPRAVVVELGKIRYIATLVLFFVSIMLLSLTSSNAAPKVASPMKDQRPYEKLIREIAARHQLPADLVHAVVKTESSYNPDAKGAAGEVGLMQIKPSTARALGYSGSVKNLYEPHNNLEYGMKYLAQAHRLSGGDTCKTILKYNAGHAAWKMNPASARYCSKVKIYLASLK